MRENFEERGRGRVQGGDNKETKRQRGRGSVIIMGREIAGKGKNIDLVRGKTRKGEERGTGKIMGRGR